MRKRASNFPDLIGQRGRIVQVFPGKAYLQIRLQGNIYDARFHPQFHHVKVGKFGQVVDVELGELVVEPCR